MPTSMMPRGVEHQKPDAGRTSLRELRQPDLSRIAQDLQIRKVQVENVVQLLDEGNTIPFITRYRKERTGGLDEEVLRTIQERVAQLRQLADRKQTILRSIEGQGKLTPELRAALLAADNPKRLEDLYLPYKPKKRTLATAAREKGLEPLALAVWGADPAVANLAELLPGFVNPEQELNTPADVLAGVQHILAELIAEAADVRSAVRSVLWDSGKLHTTRSEKLAEGQGLDYKDYFNFTEPIRHIPPHRTLAINRGEKENALLVKIEWDAEAGYRAAVERLPLPVPGTVEPLAVLPPPPATAGGGTPTTPAEGAPPAPAEAAAPPQPAPPTPAEAAAQQQTTTPPEAAVTPVHPAPPVPPPEAAAPPAAPPPAEAAPPPGGAGGTSAGGATAPPVAPGASAAPRVAVPQVLPLPERAEALRKHPHAEFLRQVTADALARLLVPSLEREIRRELTTRAENHAVSVFARNLRSKLLAPPLRGKRVLAIDPGFRTGCKLAALDAIGSLLEDGVIFPHTSANKRAEARARLEELVRKYQVHIIAIGNGTACRETEEVVSEVIAKLEARRKGVWGPEPPPPGTPPASAQPPPPAAPPAEAPAGPPAGAAPAPAPQPEAVAAPPQPEPPAPAAAQQEGGAAPLPAEAGSAAPPAEAGAPALAPAQAEASAAAAAQPEASAAPGEAGAAPAGEATPAAPPGPEAAPAPGTPPAPAAAAPTPAPAAPAPPPAPPLPEAVPDLAYVIVNEAGASVYSASPIGREEFPNYDATLRGTISIGRRLQDPLSELVKIDPQHVGVGLYQHDVNPKHLRESLEAVIESCVNAVGVDLNTASVPLLRHVSGLNQLVARELVEYRKAHGPFREREQLKEVSGIGEARFVQAAGFLKIGDGPDPLDGTWIHPESYGVARQLLADLGYGPEALRDRPRLEELRERLRAVTPEEVAARLHAGVPTVRDIIEALARPGRDPREDLPPPVFKKGVLKLEDLQPGMELKGTVLNVVDFGAFVDIGLKDSGLVHISQMANRYVKSPYDVVAVGDVVAVWVLSVDKERGRVSLTMIQPGTERRPPERKPPQPRQGGAPGRGPHPARGGGGRRQQGPPRGTRGGAQVATPAGQAGGAAAGPPAQAGAGRGAAPPPHGGQRQQQPPPPRRPPRRQPPKPKLSQAALAGKESLNTFGELAAFWEAKRKEGRPAPPPKSETPPPPPATTEEGQPPAGS